MWRDWTTEAMHFYFRTPERFTCQDCLEAVEDSKRAERKDEGLKQNE